MEPSANVLRPILRLPATKAIVCPIFRSQSCIIAEAPERSVDLIIHDHAAGKMPKEERIQESHVLGCHAVSRREFSANANASTNTYSLTLVSESQSVSASVSEGIGHSSIGEWSVGCKKRRPPFYNESLSLSTTSQS